MYTYYCFLPFLVGKEINQFQNVGRGKGNQLGGKRSRVTQHRIWHLKILAPALASSAIPFLQYIPGLVSLRHPLCLLFEGLQLSGCRDLGFILSIPEISVDTVQIATVFADVPHIPSCFLLAPSFR